MARVDYRAEARWTGEGVKTRVILRDKELLVDERVAHGGSDAGPDPLELLLAAQGACLTVLMAMLAPRFEVDLRDVRVEVEAFRDSRGMAPESGIRPGLQEIRYRIHVDSPSAPDKVKALVAQAEALCPVKDTLRGVEVKRVED